MTQAIYDFHTMICLQENCNEKAIYGYKQRNESIVNYTKKMGW